MCCTLLVQHLASYSLCHIEDIRHVVRFRFLFDSCYGLLIEQYLLLIIFKLYILYRDLYYKRLVFSGVGWLVFGVLGVTFVFHIGDVSVLVGAVGDDLGATIGEGDAVRSGNYVTFGFLRVDVVVVRFLILDSVREAVRLCGLVCVMFIFKFERLLTRCHWNLTYLGSSYLTSAL